MSRYLVILGPGDVIPDRLKIGDDAWTAPGPDDDASTLGVSVGSLWIDQDAGKVYLCRDATPGAAVWTELTGGASTSVGYDNTSSGLCRYGCPGRHR